MRKQYYYITISSNSSGRNCDRNKFLEEITAGVYDGMLANESKETKPQKTMEFQQKLTRRALINDTSTTRDHVSLQQHKHVGAGARWLVDEENTAHNLSEKLDQKLKYKE